jgi:hypothetical protein
VYSCLHINWGEPEPRVRGHGPGVRKKIEIDRADVDLLLSFCDPGSTLEEPTITAENDRRYIVVQADAERQRRLAQEHLKPNRGDAPGSGKS